MLTEPRRQAIHVTMEIYTTSRGIRTQKRAGGQSRRMPSLAGRAKTAGGFDTAVSELPLKIGDVKANLVNAFGQEAIITPIDKKTADVSLQGRFNFRIKENLDGTTHAISDINGTKVDFGHLTQADRGEHLRVLMEKMRKETEAAKQYLDKNGGRVLKASLDGGVVIEAKPPKKRKKTKKPLPATAVGELPGRSAKTDVDGTSLVEVRSEKF